MTALWLVLALFGATALFWVWTREEQPQRVTEAWISDHLRRTGRER